jgi:hypothetical protein
MTYTYAADLANDTKDLYRFHTGDTGELSSEYTQQEDATPTFDFFLADEEIEYIVATHTDHSTRMYHLYTGIANKVSKRIKRKLGPQSEDPKGLVDHYRALADEYRKANKYGGITVPTYNVDKIFTKEMHDND